MNDVVVSVPPPFQNHPLLHRRNSISASNVAVPTKLTIIPHQNSSSTTTSTTSPSSSSSSPPDDLEALIKPTSQNYTSLRDLLPSVAVNSPRPNSGYQTPGSDICIRNRLVKQAAWAYLQPMSTSPGSAGGNFFNRLCPPVAAFFDFVGHNLIRALNWMLRVIRIRGSTR
ncbi:hypothetical protein ABFS83_12G154400 [Erythranthe nasuta]